MNDARQHVVCLPFPFQSHIKGMLILAKLLHHRGFQVTYVNTDFNRDRILRSHGPAALDGTTNFRFESIPDGVPPSDSDTTQDNNSLLRATQTTFQAPFQRLLTRLAADAQSSKAPPVTCIICDGLLPFTHAAAQEFQLPVVAFWTLGACTLLGCLQYRPLMEKPDVSLQDSSYLINGCLDTAVGWIPGMKNMPLRDFIGILRTTDPNAVPFSAAMVAVESAPKAFANIVNTFSDLEPDALEALKQAFPRLYPIGPIHLLLNQLPPENPTRLINLSFWKEEGECLRWLDSKEPNTVVYVNFGSIAIPTTEQLVEFAWGLANSQRDFLWVIRRDLVRGESVVFSPEFQAATMGRTCLVGWCPQEEVLLHPAVGGFLTHCGWNSMMESLAAGVPMICWPLFADQPTNCHYCCMEWGIGTEIEKGVKRERVERLVRELMEGEGRRLKSRITEWKSLAETAAASDGSSYANLDKLIKDVSCLPVMSNEF